MPKATTGFGPATMIGAGIGAAGGVFLGAFFCGMYESSSCGGPEALGLLLGGLTGAMIGSAFEGPKSGPPAQTAAP